MKTIVSFSRTGFGTRGKTSLAQVHASNNNGEQVERWTRNIRWLRFGEAVEEEKVIDLVDSSGYFDQACNCPVHLGHRRSPLQGSRFVGSDSFHMGFDQLEAGNAARCMEYHTLHCSVAVHRSLLGCWAHCTNSDCGKPAAASGMVGRYIVAAGAGTGAAGSGHKSFVRMQSRGDH